MHCVWPCDIGESVVPFSPPCSRVVPEEDKENLSEGEGRGGGEPHGVEGERISDRTDSER